MAKKKSTAKTTALSTRIKPWKSPFRWGKIWNLWKQYEARRRVQEAVQNDTCAFGMDIDQATAQVERVSDIYFAMIGELEAIQDELLDKYPDLLGLMPPIPKSHTRPPDKEGLDSLGHAMLGLFGQVIERERKEKELNGPQKELNGPPPLTNIRAATLEVLKALPKGKGLMWQDIIRKLRERTPKITVTRSVLTSHCIPFLKKYYHVRNIRGVGYFVDTD